MTDSKEPKYARHPLSHAYPGMSKAEFRSLVRSMQDNGFDPRFPIQVYDEQIIDGWHRYSAALKAGVKPIFQEWQGDPDNLRAFITYANSTRRHLSKAAHAQALLQMQALGEPLDDEQIRRLADVSPATLQQQKRLLREHPERATNVADGTEPSESALRQTGIQSRAQRIEKWSGALSMALSKKLFLAAAQLGETPHRFVMTAVADRIKSTAQQEET